MHAKKAKFCDECAQRLIETMPAGCREHAAFCPHHGGALAQVTVEHGVIRAWRIRGPLTELEATTMLAFRDQLQSKFLTRQPLGH